MDNSPFLALSVPKVSQNAIVPKMLSLQRGKNYVKPLWHLDTAQLLMGLNHPLNVIFCIENPFDNAASVHRFAAKSMGFSIKKPEHSPIFPPPEKIRREAAAAKVQALDSMAIVADSGNVSGEKVNTDVALMGRVQANRT